jgi:hypothetical protein
MGSIKSFEDIEAWQKARLFCKDIYVITQEGSFSKDFGLRDQLYIAFDLAYINTTVFENLKEQIIVISKMISKLITYLNTKTM